MGEWEDGRGWERKKARRGIRKSKDVAEGREIWRGGAD